MSKSDAISPSSTCTRRPPIIFIAPPICSLQIILVIVGTDSSLVIGFSLRNRTMSLRRNQSRILHLHLRLRLIPLHHNIPNLTLLCNGDPLSGKILRDMFIEPLLDKLSGCLGISLLFVFVIHVGHPEAGIISFYPFKITTLRISRTTRYIIPLEKKQNIRSKYTDGKDTPRTQDNQR